MKLFQQLLVAGASLSLIAPIAAQASDEVNLEEMNSYSRSKSKPKKFDSKTFINKINDDTANTQGSNDALKVNKGLEAGTFSDTTTLDGKVILAIGAVQGANELTGAADGTNEKVQVPYVYQMNLNTSFGGDDNLYIRLKTGQGWSGAFGHKPGTYHIDNKDEDDIFKVDKIWYTFPIGGNFTATLGPKIENYYMLAATPSVYKPGALKAFKLGGHGSAFGASTSTGVGLKYVADNGFAISTTVNSKDAHSTNGWFTDEDQNKINTQVAYTADNYHLSATYSRQQGWNSWSYYSTSLLNNGVGALDVKSDSVALRGWWRPEDYGSFPSISVGYDHMEFTGRNDVTQGNGYFVGLNWADIFLPDDKIGLAIGQPMKATKAPGGANLNEVSPFMYELYYSFRPTDNIEVTPAIFGGSDIHADTDDDIFGAVIATKFKF